MRIFSVIIGILIIFAAGASADTTADTYTVSGMGCVFELPDGWLIDTTLPDMLLMKRSVDDSAEIIISRYRISESNLIRSADDLKTAIAGLYAEVGITDVNREIVDYAVHGGSASFGTEFNLYDAATGTTLYYKLFGLIGRLESNGQVLYLTIASAPPGEFETLRSQVHNLMNSLDFSDKLAAEFYPRRFISPLIMILMILALSVLFYTRNRRIQKSRNPLGKDSRGFWRCSSCGRVNHTGSNRCGRCGKERTAAENAVKN